MKYNADLHLHTIESKISGEVFYWKNLISTLKILKTNNIQVFSFTDHDSFNDTFFIQAQEINDKHNLGFTIIPGVEVTVINEKGDKGHINFYFLRNLTTTRLQQLKKIVQKNCNREGVKLMKMVDVFNENEFKFAIIAHGGKVNYLTLNDIESLKKYIYAIEGNEKHPNLQKILKNDSSYKVVLYSDTHTWNNYINPLQSLDLEEFENFIKKDK